MEDLSDTPKCTETEELYDWYLPGDEPTEADLKKKEIAEKLLEIAQKATEKSEITMEDLFTDPELQETVVSELEKKGGIDPVFVKLLKEATQNTRERIRQLNNERRRLLHDNTFRDFLKNCTPVQALQIFREQKVNPREQLEMGRMLRRFLPKESPSYETLCLDMDQVALKNIEKILRKNMSTQQALAIRSMAASLTNESEIKLSHKWDKIVLEELEETKKEKDLESKLRALHIVGIRARTKSSVQKSVYEEAEKCAEKYFSPILEKIKRGEEFQKKTINKLSSMATDLPLSSEIKEAVHETIEAWEKSMNTNTLPL